MIIYCISMNPQQKNVIFMYDEQKKQSGKNAFKLYVPDTIKGYIKNLCKLEQNLRTLNLNEVAIVDYSNKLKYNEKLYYMNKIIKCCTIYYYSRNLHPIINIDKTKINTKPEYGTK
jgi:hypothetical protein